MMMRKFGMSRGIQTLLLMILSFARLLFVSKQNSLTWNLEFGAFTELQNCFLRSEN